MSALVSPKTSLLNGLIVEDNAIDRLAILRHIKQWALPYRCTVAVSLAEAMAKLEQQTFDFAILDFHLGDGTALELVESITAQQLPFIVTTGSGDEDIAVQMMQKGAYTYLTKDPQRHYLKVLPTVIEKAIARKYHEDRIRLLTYAIQHVRDGVYIADQTHQLLFVNHALSQICHCSPEAIIGQPIQALNQAELTRCVETAHTIEHREAHPLTAEIDLTQADQSPFTALLSESCFQEAGQHIRVGLLRDISHLKQVERDLQDARDGLEQTVAQRTAQLQQANQALQAEVEERRRTEHRLRESEQRYASLAAAVPVGIFRTDAAGNCTYVNERWCHIAGVDATAALGHGWRTCIYLGDRTSVLAAWPPASQDHHHHMEYRMQRPDGSITWVYGQSVPEYDAQNIFIGLVSTITDISDRKQAETALIQSEAKSRAILAAIPDLMFRVGADGVYREFVASQEIPELLSTPNPVGQAMFQIVPSDIASRQMYFLEQALHTRTIQVYEQQIEVDSQLRDEEVRVVQSGLDEVLFIVRDISHRKQAERALQILNYELETKVEQRTAELKEREQFLQTVLDTFPLSVFWKDRNSVYLGCNRNFLHDAGLTSLADIAGKTDYDMPWRDTQAHTYQANDRQVMDSGTAKLGIIETQTLGNHQQIWVETNEFPLHNLAGDVVGVLGTYQDITESKQAEVQLQRTNEELARATRLKDEFLANMSHELRTPLNAILGMTEGLQEHIFGEINHEQSKALKTIEHSSSHLLELINDILDVAKIESGQITLELAPTTVSSLCQSSLTFIKQQALKKRLCMDVKLPADLPDLLVDERRIRQVLINLLNNAVKFTPEGGHITLEISRLEPVPCSTSIDCPAPNFLRIAVIDTGIGIAPEHIDNLFKPFVQIDSSLNRQYTGTGLGLTLAKRIVDLHGGQLELTSEVGIGSCFTIDLPCLKSTSPAAHPSISSILNAEPFQPARESSPMILLAEDNEANISTTSSYLRANGCRILLAQDGYQAITLAQLEQPDLILMDIQMPQMDGLEATARIRQNLALKEVPIIALTALAMPGDRERCLQAGANEYLSKPFKMKHLMATIQRLLGCVIN